MEDRETARMRKYGEIKRLELWWQMYRTSFPVWDLENFRPMDFYWHECTTIMDCCCELLMDATNAVQCGNCSRSNLKNISLWIIDIMVINSHPHFLNPANIFASAKCNINILTAFVFYYTTLGHQNSMTFGCFWHAK